MSCHFGSMPKDTLDNILLSKLEPLSMSEPLQRSIMKKFEKYNITGASVDNIVTAISSFKDADDELCAIQEEKDLDLDGRVGFAV